MERAGVFAGERLELLDGDLIDKMGQNPPHAFALQRLTAALSRVYGNEYIRVQSPLEVLLQDRTFNFPEPDLAVTRERDFAFEQRHPGGPEAVLVVEVADTSTQQDLTAKRRLYSRAGVAEYWVVDIGRRVVVVHQESDGEDFSRVNTIPENGNLLAGWSGQSAIEVASLLPTVKRA